MFNTYEYCSISIIKDLETGKETAMKYYACHIYTTDERIETTTTISPDEARKMMVDAILNKGARVSTERKLGHLFGRVRWEP